MEFCLEVYDNPLPRSWTFTMPRLIFAFPIVLLSISMASCGGDPFWLPRAHKITIQQGNLVNEAQLQRVTIGMERELVRNLIGSPVINNSFRDDRWEYVYTQGPAGVAIKARRVSILFEDNKVASIEDNQNLESGEVEPQRYFWEKKE